MMKWPRHPSAIVVVFSLGILLPAAVLSYIGFGSFHTEEALNRQQAEERHAGAADRLSQESGALLTTSETTLKHLAVTSAFTHGDLPVLSRALLSVKTLGGNPFQALVLMDNQNQILYPTVESVSPASDEEVSWGVLDSKIRQLDRLEFQNKNYAEALAGYRDIPIETLSPLQQISILKSIAGLERKSGNDSAAASTYRDLIERFDRMREPNQIPEGLVARELLARLFESEKDLVAAFSVRLDMAEGLLLQRWTQVPSRRERLDDLLDSLSKTSVSIHEADLQDRWDQLYSWNQTMAQQAQALASWPEDLWPDVFSRLQKRGWSDRGGVLRMRAGQPDESWVIVVPVWDPTGTHRRGLLIAKIDASSVWKSTQSRLEDQAEPLGLHAQIHVLPEARTGKSLMTRELMDFDPPILITFQTSTVDGENGQSQRRLKVYGGIIGLSLFVLLIGFLLMGYAVQQERRLAAFKADFVTAVSHELRTPLASIRYIAERLWRGRYRSMEEVRELYGMLNEEGGRLEELIDDVLQISKMEAGKNRDQLVAVDLRDIATEALDRLAGKAEANGFELSWKNPAEAYTVIADRRAAVQAASNLIDNAMKYSGDSRRIIIALKSGETLLGLEVSDQGLGIAADDQSRVFEKFYRAARKDKSVAGVGLGLAMVKHIMDSHHGRITLSSELGKGSRFTLWFPTTPGGTA